jgi:hypothetical protein
MRPRPLSSRARDLVRFNAYASFACAFLVLAVVFPPANRAGISRLAVAGLVVALVLAGGDELGLAVGRRLRRWHIVPFALMNAVCSAACVALLASADGLGVAARLVVGGAASLFGFFAVLETRAARLL